ncbi:MAG: acetylxylan esterase [Candidatus Omnitrophota bacterium]
MKTLLISLFFLFTLCFGAVSMEIETNPSLDQSNNIRNYLQRAASAVTHHSLDGIVSFEDWNKVRESRYREFLEMMSLTDVPMKGERPPLNTKIVGTIQKDGFKIVKLYYESLPQLYVPANLYIPDNLKTPAPGVLYVCGHSRTQKVHYQPFPRRFAQLGFVCLIVETIQWGEVLGHHWGCYSEGRFNWYSRGYTPGGVELWNGVRGLDLLCSLKEVDPERLGVTGISGGGAYSWYIAAGDPRIKVAAPVCGTSTVESHIHGRTIDGHCDCMTPINTYLRDFHDVGALIAPRPLMIASADRDGLNTIESVRQSYEYIKKIYDLYGAEDRLKLVETPGGHSYHEISRTKIFSFFIQHLMGKEIPPEKVGDIDEAPESQLSEDDLRVYVNGAPADDRTITIDHSFQKMAEAPSLQNREELLRHKNNVIDFLKKETFRAFPANPPDLDLRWEFRDLDGNGGQRVYSFVSEEGFRLNLDWRWSGDPDEKKPLVLALRNPEEKRWETEGFVSGLPSSWNQAYFAARGIGETSWGPELQWHVRRASAWTGRTVASMRVYDVLRCLDAIRQLGLAPDDKIAIAARGEMAAIALYAALLDGKVHTLLLKDPPPTQDAEGSPDGRGEATEMLNCLRITDLPQTAALVWPTRVQFIGQPDGNYQWAMDTIGKIDKDHGMLTIGGMREWKP